MIPKQLFAEGLNAFVFMVSFIRNITRKLMFTLAPTLSLRKFSVNSRVFRMFYIKNSGILPRRYVQTYWFYSQNHYQIHKKFRTRNNWNDLLVLDDSNLYKYFCSNWLIYAFYKHNKIQITQDCISLNFSCCFYSILLYPS